MTDILLHFCKVVSDSDQSHKNRLPIGYWELIAGDEYVTYGLCSHGMIEFPERYCILVAPDKMIIRSSLFSIYPIFVYQDENDIYISSSIAIMVGQIGNRLTVNRKYLLEQLLFNYSISDSTIYKEIKRVPTNTQVEIGQEIIYSKVLAIEEHFEADKTKWKSNMDELVELFISLNSESILNGDCVSFTGGFDGRSLVGLGKYLGKSFFTSSFGSIQNDDLTLPRKQAEKLGLEFFPVVLDHDYIKEFWNIGEKLVLDSSLDSNLSQVHWVYSAKQLSKKTTRLVTGIFGSELFRTFHLPGQFISHNMVDLFKSEDTKTWSKNMYSSLEISWLDIHEVRQEIEEIIECAHAYKQNNSNLTMNQQLYKFGFEESFRKFFGDQFIIPMSKNLKVITPFLKWEFIVELLGTKYSGVNNDFMTGQPIKRLNGQMFYAKFLEKIYPPLLNYETSKGYKPIDLLTLQGKYRIAKSFFLKRFKRKIFSVDLDNLAIISSLDYFECDLRAIEFRGMYKQEVFDHLLSSKIYKTSERHRNKYLQVLSQIIFLTNTKSDI